MMTAIEVDPRKLQPSNNPRRKPITPERINEIARSMSDPDIGVIEALVVRVCPRPVNGYTHQVIAGDTRRLAAIEAKLDMVPCVVKDLDDLAILKLQLIENIQRNDMHYIDEGEALAKLVASKRETVDSLVQSFGKSRRWIYQRMEFTKLIPDLKKLLVTDDRFTASHAERLVRLNEAQQKEAAKHGLFTTAPESGDDIACSVEELDDWIEAATSLDISRPVVGELFPDVIEAQRVAEAMGKKALMVSDGFGSNAKGVLPQDAYKRATGKESCTFAQPAVMVEGPDTGRRLDVCVNKECEKHFPKPKKQAAAKVKSLSPAQKAAEKREEAADQKRRAKHAAWMKLQEVKRARAEKWHVVARQLRPIVRDALRKVKTLPPSVLQVLAPRAMPSGTKIKKLGVSVTGDFARAVCVAHFAGQEFEASYYEKDLRAIAKALKIDVAAIERPAAAAKAKKGTK